MKELYKIARKHAAEVYNDNIDLGTTEFRLKEDIYKDEVILVLAIAGSNEGLDWWKNVILLSWKGFKYAAYQAAKQIQHRIKIKEQASFYPSKKIKLLVTGHSKAGATVPAFLRLFGATWGVAFNPAPSMRRWSNTKFDNLTIFIHKNDPVSKAGIVNFCHPECKTIYNEAPGAGYDVSYHLISLWDNVIDGLKEV